MKRCSEGRWAALVGAALVLVCSASEAAKVTLSQFPPNPGVLPGGGFKFTPGTTFGDPPGPRMWTNGVYGGVPSVRAIDTLNLPGKAGALPVSVRRDLPLAEAAGVVAACLGASLPVCAGSAAVAAALAYADYRIKAREQVPGSVVPAGSLDYDPGTDEVSEGGWKAGDAPAAATQQAACEVSWALYTSGGAGVGYSPQTYMVGEVPYCRAAHNSLPGAYEQNWSPQLFPAPVMLCPMSIDALNPAYTIQKGMPKVGGKCPTARYNHVPLSPAEAAQKVVQAPPAVFPGGAWQDAVRDAIDTGGQQAPANISTTGPASQTGQPITTTTTTSSGTITKTETPTYSYVYGGDTITWNVTTTTITNNAGDVTTEVVETPAPANPETLEPEDPCAKDPERVGCKKLGTPPEDAPQWESRDIPFQAEDLGFGGSCPAPHVMQWRGIDLVLNFQPACDVAPVTRVALLVLTSLSALFFVVSTVGKSS